MIEVICDNSNNSQQVKKDGEVIMNISWGGQNPEEIINGLTKAVKDIYETGKPFEHPFEDDDSRKVAKVTAIIPEEQT